MFGNDSTGPTQSGILLKYDGKKWHGLIKPHFGGDNVFVDLTHSGATVTAISPGSNAGYYSEWDAVKRKHKGVRILAVVGDEPDDNGQGYGESPVTQLRVPGPQEMESAANSYERYLFMEVLSKAQKQNGEIHHHKSDDQKHLEEKGDGKHGMQQKEGNSSSDFTAQEYDAVFAQLFGQEEGAAIPAK
ncbi:unnamed protein product, partial [Prorocentrum cordatum]